MFPTFQIICRKCCIYDIKFVFKYAIFYEHKIFIKLHCELNKLGVTLELPASGLLGQILSR